MLTTSSTNIMNIVHTVKPIICVYFIDCIVGKGRVPLNMNTSNRGVALVELGQRIRHLRKRAGISARALASKAGLTQSHLSKLETGAAKPSLEALERICRAMGVSLAEFFAAGEEQLCLPAHIDKLFQELKSLTPKQAKYLREFVAAMKEDGRAKDP
jgi:transcriptional regulator with XRE-family HTH domain